MTEIWHNPRCSKSRQTLALLEERGVDAHVVRYLDEAPSAKRIREVLALLGVPAIGLIRTKESLFAELGLSKQDDDETLIAAMAANPRLIERPLVITEKGARLGRPPEAVLEVL